MDKPIFSVIIATRDRPQLFGQALESVISQLCEEFEVIVVDDGSSETNAAIYKDILENAWTKAKDRLRVFSLVRRPRGHGQSYSLNFGATNAKGEYLCFLDDDDRWVDNNHLLRAAEIIGRISDAGREVDLYMANQKAFVGDEEVPGDLWLSRLASELQGRGAVASIDGSYEVAVGDLMATSGFCHLNCLIVRRGLFESIAGLDEDIRWEGDRDFFLRLIDKSKCMVHHPQSVSRHHVPDPTKSSNMTTALSMLEKRLLQIRVLEKAVLFAQHPLIRAHGKEHKGYALKKISELLAEDRRWKQAAYWARQGLAASPNIKWAFFYCYCGLRGLVPTKDGGER